MRQTKPRYRLDLLGPLALGTLSCLALWLVGAGQLGWLGFVLAALAWPAFARGGGARADDRQWNGDDVTVGAPRGGSSRTAGGAAEAVAPSPGRYLVDPQATVVHFTVRKLWLFPVHGTFSGASGTLDVSEEVQRSRLVAAVSARSFLTRDPRRDQHVRGPAFLDAAHHPTLRFESNEVRGAADGGWTVRGALTVRGVAAPVTLSVQRADVAEAGRLMVVAGTTLRRSSFGVTAYRWLAGDELQVRIEAQLQPATRS
jgi:polyisoprenoid-binding protein YceI